MVEPVKPAAFLASCDIEECISDVYVHVWKNPGAFDPVFGELASTMQSPAYADEQEIRVEVLGARYVGNVLLLYVSMRDLSGKTVCHSIYCRTWCFMTPADNG